MTGTRLTSLLTAPFGFTVDQSGSYDSGDVPVARSGTNPQRLSCATWWAGGTDYGPISVGYAVKEFVGSDQTNVSIFVVLYSPGGGTVAFDETLALHERCTHFTYRDSSTHLQYQVDVQPGSSAGLGDRSWTFDAVESAGGEEFPTEETLIQVGDAYIGISQTGPAGSDPTPLIPPLTPLIKALRAAGF